MADTDSTSVVSNIKNMFYINILLGTVVYHMSVLQASSTCVHS